jgi:N-acyl-D-amino-acid deacylase
MLQPLLHRVALTIVLALPPSATAADEAPKDQETRIATAIERGLTVVQTAARNYPTHRECFSCHHQTLPALAMVTALDAGYEIDAPLLAEQLQFTRTFFEGKAESLASGGHIGGRAATVSYGLWMLDLCDADADDVSDALVANLLGQQREDGRWSPPSNRPPLEVSDVSCTLFSAYGVQKFARDERREAADAAVNKALSWLKSAERVDHEDRIAHVWALHLFEDDSAAIAAARDDLLSHQRADGGWGQTDDMESDAYATGQALYVLRLVGMSAEEEPLRRGIDYLLGAQKPDGSWHVVTRSKPVQVFFDNGDPHGKDQFISISATSWAVAALAQCAPKR